MFVGVVSTGFLGSGFSVLVSVVVSVLSARSFFGCVVLGGAIALV